MALFLCLTCLCQVTTSSVPQSNNPSIHDDTIMALYHHIHHLELLHHGPRQPYVSVLLDTTRARLQARFPDNQYDQYQPPAPQTAAQQQQLLHQHHPLPSQHLRLSHRFAPAHEQTTSVFGTPLPDENDTPNAPQAAQSTPPKAPRPKPVLLPDEELSRELASSEEFNIPAVWDGVAPTPDLPDPTSSCQDMCDCLASELLFGISRGVLPYKPNDKVHDRDTAHFPDADDQIFRFASVPDETIPIWYRQAQNKWWWTPYDPTDAGFFVSGTIERRTVLLLLLFFNTF